MKRYNTLQEDEPLNSFRPGDIRSRGIIESDKGWLVLYTDYLETERQRDELQQRLEAQERNKAAEDAIHTKAYAALTAERDELQRKVDEVRRLVENAKTLLEISRLGHEVLQALAQSAETPKPSRDVTLYLEDANGNLVPHKDGRWVARSDFERYATPKPSGELREAAQRILGTLDGDTHAKYAGSLMQALADLVVDFKENRQEWCHCEAADRSVGIQVHQCFYCRLAILFELVATDVSNLKQALSTPKPAARSAPRGPATLEPTRCVRQSAT